MDNARRQPFVSDTIVKPLELPCLVHPPAKLSRCDYRATLAKSRIESDLAFMPYPTTPAAQKIALHTHIRCTLCILDTKLDEVTEALGKALTMGYRQRSKNLAFLIDTPWSAPCWPAYCVKEYTAMAGRLEAEPDRKAVQTTLPNN